MYYLNSEEKQQHPFLFNHSKNKDRKEIKAKDDFFNEIKEK